MADDFDDTSKNLREIHQGIVGFLRRYMSMKDEHYDFVALWTIANHFIKFFETFPFLFINAIKGSGKTRLQKILAFFSYNGYLITQPSQAFLFRQAGESTFCIDEAEGFDRDEMFQLRQLLQTAYKRGLSVPRINVQSKEFTGEMFETFCAISLSNIWGFDDVLRDRCIEIVLEKSNNPKIVKKVERWDKEADGIELKRALENLHKSEGFQSLIPAEWGVSEDVFSDIPKILNDILDNMQTETDYENAFNNLDWSSGKYKIELSKPVKKFFIDLLKADVSGREMELFLPLFMVARFISEELFQKTIAFAEETSKERAEKDVLENRDSRFANVMVNFIQGKTETEFYSYSEIRSSAEEILGEVKQTKNGQMVVLPRWFNHHWIGWALDRNRFVRERDRKSKGMKARLNFEKIRQRAKMLGIEPEEKQTTLTIEKEKPDRKDYAENP